MRLRSSFIQPSLIAPHERDRMFDLMQACYENLHRAQFDRDLDKKWLVIQVHDPATDTLVGFSTQVVLHTEVEGEPIRALYSGDTVMAPSYWGDKSLANAWGQLALQLIDEADPDPLYWFLTSKGFRTYRYLPLFFRQYYPRLGTEGSGHYHQVVDSLGKLVARDAYDCQQRIVRTDSSRYFARPRAVDPGLRVRYDPHVQYFVEQNPGYARGDELCCVAPLTRGNFTSLAYRVINASTASQPVH